MSEGTVKTAIRTVMPIIAVESADELHNYYTEKLGFGRVMGVVGKDGEFDFVGLVREGASIMFTRMRAQTDNPRPAGGTQPVEIYLEVGNVDAYHDELKRRGVKIAEPLTTQWWGDRTFKVIDPAGYKIWFHQKGVGELKPPQGMKIV
jgi:uncharacterized glyoxalase superfamily protein PhnB